MLGAVFIFLRFFFFKYKKNISYQIFELLISKYFLISKNNFYFLKNSIFRYQKFEIIDIRKWFFHIRKSIFDIKSWPSFNDIKISSFFIVKKIIFWYKELHDIKKIPRNSWCQKSFYFQISENLFCW